eukprot:NODE_219_length_14015_cov_0.496335.p4 type:complete len:319 gc:universal NODE_219_length_14015_cov_0.496335:3889-2933(-)
MLKRFFSKSLTIQRTKFPKELPPLDSLVFGKSFSDHMFIVDFDNGWKSPRIVPYQPIALDPSCSVFHYATECFEGMKAYKDKSNNIRLFRPSMNMRRFNSSAERLALPQVSEQDLLHCIKELCKVDSKFIPNQKGYSLYIRPTLIGTSPSLGVSPSTQAKLFVICSPVGPYFKEGFKPISLYATTKFARAWKGGSGSFKIGANYSPTIVPQKIAQSQGHSQVLWLVNDELSEVGTMNIFVYWIKDGKKELVTPPLDGTILPGVTRDSILKLAESMGIPVRQGKITMTEIIKNQKNVLITNLDIRNIWCRYSLYSVSCK